MFKLCITGNLGFEFWEDVPEYEGIYQASTYGRIKNMNGKILKPSRHHSGYAIVSLSKNKKQRSINSHNIISALFLPKWKREYTQINHKDENKFNNRVENLEWCTPKYNSNYGTRNKRTAEARVNHPKISKRVLQFDLDGNCIGDYPSSAEVERRTGYFHTAINSCCIGKLKTAYGFKWQYADFQ